MNTNTNDYVTGATDGERLTKREYFAAMALQGILADSSKPQCSEDKMAIHAVRCADALIYRLKNQP